MCEAQVVVIGSGPCGAAAAWQLVRHGVPVIMLESGHEEPTGVLVRALGRNLFRKKPSGTFGSDRAEHSASADPMTKWYFDLTPGGLSNHWTGAVPRYTPEDFTDGERLHEKYRWPVSYSDLVPYYERIERLMDVVGSGADVPNLPGGYTVDTRRLPRDWRAVARVVERYGQGLTPLPLADGPRQLVVRRGTAFNSYSNLLKPLMRSPLFSMRRGAHALRLEWSADKHKVGAVVYHDRIRRSEQRLEAAAFVVAAGALQTTRLLFDSKSNEFPTGLGNSRDLLGRYLHDHPHEWWMVETQKALSRVSPSIYLTRRAYSDTAPLLATSWTIGAPTTREKLLGFTPLKSRLFGVQVFGTMIPTASHRVTPVLDTTDAFGSSKLDLHIQFDDTTKRNVVDARERFQELLSAAGVPNRILPVPPGQLVPGTSVHYGGTARMHRSPEYGVTDEWNRLHDASNVLVCDAACFTTGPEKNPTLTAMALSARACERLVDTLRHPTV